MELTQTDIDQCTRTQKTYVHRINVQNIGIAEIHYTEGVHLVATIMQSVLATSGDTFISE